MSLDTSRATGQGSGVDLQLCNLICIDLLISRVIVAIAAALFLAAAFLLVTRLTCWRNYLFRRRLEARPTSLTFCWRNCLFRRKLEARSTSLTFIAAALFLAAAFLLVTRLTCWRNYLFRRRLEARPTSLTFCWRNCLYRRRLEARSTSLTFWKRCRREIGGSAGACSCFMLPKSVRLWGR